MNSHSHTPFPLVPKEQIPFILTLFTAREISMKRSVPEVIDLTQEEEEEEELPNEEEELPKEEDMDRFFTLSPSDHEGILTLPSPSQEPFDMKGFVEFESFDPDPPPPLSPKIKCRKISDNHWVDFIVQKLTEDDPPQYQDFLVAKFYDVIK